MRSLRRASAKDDHESSGPLACRRRSTDWDCVAVALRRADGRPARVLHHAVHAEQLAPSQLPTFSSILFRMVIMPKHARARK